MRFQNVLSFALCLLSLFPIGCVASAAKSPETTVTYLPETPTTQRFPKPFSGKSDADLLVEAMEAIVLPHLQIQKEEQVSLGSLDAFFDAEYQEYPLKYNLTNQQLEDVLIEKLSGQGVQVLDRSIYTLEHLHGDGYFPTPLLPHGLDTGKSGLQYSDKVLSFRILKCGVGHFHEPKVLLGEGINSSDAQEVLRRAEIKIHFRLSSTTSGVVLWSDTLTGTSQEFTSPQFLGLAQDGNNFEVSYYSFPTRSETLIRENDSFSLEYKQAVDEELKFRKKNLFQQISSKMFSKAQKPKSKK